MEYLSIVIFLVGACVYNGFIFEGREWSFFKSFGIIVSTIIVLAFFFGWISIPLSLLTYGCALLSFGILGATLLRRKRNFRELSVLIIDSFAGPSKVAIVTGICAFCVGWVYFRGNLQQPQYYTVDPAVHYILGKKVHENRSILFFNNDLYLPDSAHAEEYPFGNAVMTDVFSRLAPGISYDFLFQLYDIVLLVLLASISMEVFLREFRISAISSRILLGVLVVFGFYFSMLVLGFTPQALGLFLVFVFFEFYRKRKNAMDAVFAGIVFAAILFTYVYWAPVIAFYVLFSNIRLLHPRNWFTQKEKWIHLLVFIAVFLMIVSYFVFRQVTSGILGASLADGTAYKVFLLNFIIFVPVILYGGWVRMRAPSKGDGEMNAFVLSGVFFTGILYGLYRAGVVSSYTMTKSYVLLGPLIYALAVFGIDAIHKMMKKPLKLDMSLVYLFILIYICAFAPFQRNSQCIESVETPTFDMNTLGLDGRVLDLFSQQSLMLFTQKSHWINVSDERSDFFEMVRAELDKRGVKKISVISEYDTALWFYAKTGIWPRSLAGDLQFLYTPGQVPYSTWKIEDTSRMIILLDGGKSYNWVTVNGFEKDDFEIVLQVGNDFLLKEKPQINRGELE